MPEFGKVVVFGTGLIGGSFALALKEADAVEEVVGFGRTPSTLRVAQQLGVIDRAGINPTHEIEDADIILVATPVAQMPEIFARIEPYLGPNTIVTDGGSTKGDVVAAARAAFGERIRQFVPAHPIAGAENSGPGAARGDLYRGKKVVVTPLPENSDDTLDHIKRAWSICGADIYELTPAAHDRVFAAVSHLPHLLSYALVHELAVREDADIFFTFAASGFVISPESPLVTRKCGVISASPTGRPCSANWTVTERSLTSSGWRWPKMMANAWKRCLASPVRRAVNGLVSNVWLAAGAPARLRPVGASIVDCCRRAEGFAG